MSRPEKTHPLFHWRKANGNVSLQDLADDLKCTQSFLSQIETGLKQPSLTLAVKLSDLTGIPVEAFAKTEAAQ
jgi:transcriptional regulator with XRE-family HTH domain